MVDDGNAQVSRNPIQCRTGTSTQSNVFKTVQMNRAVNFDTAQGLVGLYDTSHLQNSDEVLSQQLSYSGLSVDYKWYLLEVENRFCVYRRII